MPYVNIKITKEGATPEQKAELIRGTTELLVRVGDTVFDGSLDNRLDKMRVEMANRTTQIIRDSLQRFLVTE